MPDLMYVTLYSCSDVRRCSPIVIDIRMSSTLRFGATGAGSSGGSFSFSSTGFRQRHLCNIHHGIGLVTRLKL